MKARKLLTTVLVGLLLQAVFTLGATSAHAWYRPGYFGDARVRHCTPLTYGFPNSCHESPWGSR